MNKTDVRQYIMESFEGVDVLDSDDGTSYFFYNPDTSVPPDHRFPFVTIVTSDVHDQFSDLNRENVFRLNIGVRKETFESLFGDTPGSYDFTALDTVMPHPVYADYHWLAVINPGSATFEAKIQSFLDEAYEMATERYGRKVTRKNKK